ncbi:MAG TPA: arginase family protein [Acidobacteriota bacterium]
MRVIEPWFGLGGRQKGDKTVVVVGCPFGGGEAFRSGAAGGPAAIRDWARTAEAVTEVGHPIVGLRVVDHGDVQADGATGEGRWAAIEAAAGAALADSPGAFLLGLGGDHAVTPPLAAAVREVHGELGFLLLDAHPDCFESYDGDPLSHACVIPRLWDRCGYRPEHTCIAGVRSYAVEELPVMDTAGLVVPSRPWLALGGEALAAEIRELTGRKPLYISLDIDLLDPAHAPGTGYPVAGGPDVRELLELLRAIWSAQPVVALDLVEVAPQLDPSGITAANAAHVLLQVLGHVAAS